MVIEQRETARETNISLSAKEALFLIQKLAEAVSLTKREASAGIFLCTHRVLYNKQGQEAHQDYPATVTFLLEGGN